jgi:hypothetical protein
LDSLVYILLSILYVAVLYATNKKLYALLTRELHRNRNLNIYGVLLDCAEDGKNFFLHFDIVANDEAEIIKVLKSSQKLDGISFHIDEIECKQKKYDKGEAKIVSLTGRTYYD